jgi:hypothetical protein
MRSAILVAVGLFFGCVLRELLRHAFGVDAGGHEVVPFVRSVQMISVASAVSGRITVSRSAL